MFSHICIVHPSILRELERIKLRGTLFGGRDWRI